MKRFVVAGIGTGIGKTVVAAIITEALQADYWKPVQSGSLENTDTNEVCSLVSNQKSFFHNEAYRLTEPLSPHAAAAIDDVFISPQNLELPNTSNCLVIELAGGVMVPLNNQFLNVDLLQKWQAPVILVSQNYLGSINHTLLTIEALLKRQISIAGIVFNGETKQSTEEFILQYSGLPCLARVNMELKMNKEIVLNYAKQIKPVLERLFL